MTHPPILFRYLDEQTFRFNTRKMSDGVRSIRTASQIVGKRLIYAEVIGVSNGMAKDEDAGRREHVEETTTEPTTLDRLRELTRKVLAVPKSEIDERSAESETRVTEYS